MPERTAVRLVLAALATAVLLLAACSDSGGREPLGRVAFVRDGDLWVAGADGSDGRKLVDADSLDLGDVSSPKPASASASAPYIERPEWSADGEWLSFAVPRPVKEPWGPWFYLFVVRRDGSGLSSPWSENWRSDDYGYGFYGVRDWKWSPVGAELATAVFGAPAGSFYIRVFDPVKQDDAWPLVPQTLTSGFEWLLDGSQIAVNFGGGPFDPSPVQNYRLVLYGRTDSPGAPYTGQEKPVYEYQGSFTSPRLHSVAPDGSRILLWDSLESGPPVQPLSAVSLDGSGAKTHIIDTYHVADWAAAWSPDSSAIAGIQGGERTGWQGRRLFVATADGSRLLDNTGEEMADTHPAWSPDASRVAFVRAPERPENAGLGEGHIWITPRDGPPVQVTDDPAYTERYPQWSPDGASILFVRLPADAVERETVAPELWAMSPDGTNQRKLLELGDMPGTTALMTDDWGHFFDWKPIGEEPAEQSPTATPPTPSPSPALPSALPLEIGPESTFPENTALIIETGCWQCDGPSAGLDRVYQRPDGSWSRETLFEPSLLGLAQYVDSAGTQRAPHIAGFAVAPGLSEMAVGVCVGGSCAVDGLDAWTPDSLLAVYRSVDGGVTWNRLGEIAAGLSFDGIVAPGRYLVSRAEERNVITHEIFPGGEPVKPPAGAQWPFGVAGGEALWLTEDSRILASDGSLFVDLGASAQPGRVSSDGARTVILWHWTIFPGEGKDFVTVIEKGSLSTYRLPGLSLAMIPFTGQTLLGNVTYPDGRYAPSIIDLKDGALHPIGDPFPEADFPPGRDHIVAFQAGPFARVVNTGSCLNIRDAPSLDSNVLTCAADRVLLRIDSAAPPAPGWLTVTTPSGTRGYASTQYLEIPFP